MILFTMSGYDEFLNGAFWFFRGLLVASLMFLLIYKIIDSKTRFSPVVSVGIICLVAVIFNAVRFALNFKIPFIPQGGLREVWGMFFFGIGVLYRYYEKQIGNRWYVTTVCLMVMLIGAWFGWCGMETDGKMKDVVTLPLTGIAGFLVTKHLAHAIDRREGRISRTLTYIGDNTLYILIFHTLSFKLISALKIWWYDLDPRQISSHMVIHTYSQEDAFWLLYTVVGIAVPLLLVFLWRKYIEPNLHHLIPVRLRKIRG